MGLKLLVFVSVAALFLALFYKWDTFNPESIRGKRILITGASSGIGEELAYQYSKLGAAIVITARRNELLQKVASKCKLLGADKVEYIAADMARSEDRQKVVSFSEKQLGGLDHLILNHAYLNVAFWQGTSDNIATLLLNMEVNFVSFVDIASKCLKMLIESKGNIGVVSSTNGKMGIAMTSSYIASKHALQGFFGSLRQELKLRRASVSVTMCVLGFIATDKANDLVAETFDKDKLSHGFFAYPAVVNETALAILKGVHARQYEIYFPKIAWLTITAHNFFPEYIEYLISNRIYTAAKYVPPFEL